MSKQMFGSYANEKLAASLYNANLNGRIHFQPRQRKQQAKNLLLFSLGAISVSQAI